MKKTFALLVTMLFAVSSIVLAHPLVEEKESLVVYDNAGNEVASLPLEKKGAKNEITVPEIERAMDAIIVDENGNVTEKVQVEKKSSTGDLGTMAIGAKIATVAVAADEEYRNAHSDWVSTTGTLVEEMDDAFNRDHNFDLDIKAYLGWNSDGANQGALLSDLRNDWGSQYSYDFLIGFANDTDITSVGGIANKYTSNPSGMAVSVVNGTQSYSGIWHAGQHELSHNFGLGHHEDSSYCIMNYDYAYRTDTWEAAHDSQIETNEAWYGVSY